MLDLGNLVTYILSGRVVENLSFWSKCGCYIANLIYISHLGEIKMLSFFDSVHELIHIFQLGGFRMFSLFDFCS
jgi:hypothetical protein